MSVSLSIDGPGDAELISAVRGGDVDAYGELFARHVDAARRLARQLAGPADADDLVSDAFTKVLTVLQRGGGPDLAFRAYLLTAVRRLHVDKVRSGSRLRPVDDLTPFDPGLPFHDTAVEGFENAAAARAFASLPERWQMVLWHMEVEQQKPAEIAPLLGMSANSVSALAYRAREGLRQAFLSQHATDPDDVDCAWTRDHLGAYVRGGLSRRDAQKVDDHLAVCRACAAVYLELTEVNSGLAALLAPMLLGAAGAGYLSSGGTGAGGALSSGFAAAKSWAAAHASLTAIGGLAVTATAVFSIYGATHLHGHSAADVGSPNTLDRPAATSTLPSGGDSGQPAPGGSTHDARDNGQSRGPNAPGSSGPSVPTQSTAPGTSPTSADSAPPVGAPSSPATSEPTSPSSSEPTGNPTTHPTNGPTNSPNPPSQPKPIKFDSTPPSNPTFGSRYRVTATGGSGHITFSVDPSTTNDSCTLVKPHVVLFQHAGTCVIAAHDSSKTAARAVLSGRSSRTDPATQKIVIHRQSQSIVFRSSAPQDARVDGPAYTVRAVGGDSGNPVTYGGNAACAADGNTVVFQHAEPCTVTAHQDGNADYHPATATQTFDVGKGTPKISLAPPANPVVDGRPFTADATSNSDGSISYSVPSSVTACALAGDGVTVSFQHAATCTIEVHQAEGTDYTARDLTESFDVKPGTPDFTFTLPATGNVKGSDPLTATSSDSEGKISYSLDPNTNVCTLNQANTNVEYHHIGECHVTATLAATTDYETATLDRTVTVSPGSQVVSFTSTSPSDAVVGGSSYTATATGGDSGNKVTFSSGTPDVCTVTNDGTVTFQHVGTCIVNADQQGNTDYNDATQAHQQFTVGKGEQHITFTSTAPANAVVGGPSYTSTATGGPSDNPVTFSSGSADVCRVSPSGTVTFQRAQACTVVANIAGNADYNGATATQTFAVGKGSQAVTFETTAPTNPAFNDTYVVQASSDAGIPVTVSVDPTSNTLGRACSVSGSTVTFNHAGTCTITATAGNDDYNTASASQAVVVNKQPQTIQITPTAPTKANVGDMYPFTATGGGSGNAVQVTTSNNDVCTVGNSTVAFLIEGPCVITATQAGNDDYAAAPPVAQTVKVVFPTSADLAVTAQNEGDQGNFTQISGTVTGLPPGGSALLRVSPQGSYAVKPVNDQGACSKDGPAAYICAVTSDQTTFYFDVNVQPNGGSRTVDFDVTPVKPANDPDLRNNSFPLKLND